MTMTRRKALKTLTLARKVIANDWKQPIGTPEALDMAIEALSKPNYESDTEVRLAVTDRNKDKVVLWDAFGEVEYYPNGEINCVHCPRYHETEDDTGVHSHCGSHGRLIDADALLDKLPKVYYGSTVHLLINDAPTISTDRPMWETCFACPLSNCCPKIQGATNEDTQKYASEVPEGCPIDRPHGEWILECDSEGEGDNLYRCSKCGCEYGCQEYDKPNFCLDCGADMRQKK